MVRKGEVAEGWVRVIVYGSGENCASACGRTFGVEGAKAKALWVSAEACAFGVGTET